MRVGRRLRLWMRKGWRLASRVVDRWLTPLPEPRRVRDGLTWRDCERARGVRKRLRIEG